MLIPHLLHYPLGKMVSIGDKFKDREDGKDRKIEKITHVYVVNNVLHVCVMASKIEN